MRFIYSNDQCGFATKTKACLREHVNRMHKTDTVYHCDFSRGDFKCEAVFSNRNALGIHRKKHLISQKELDPIKYPFQCDLCLRQDIHLLMIIQMFP